MELASSIWLFLQSQVDKISLFGNRGWRLRDGFMQGEAAGRIAISAIVGMGGIGKTELALQYALKHLDLEDYLCGISCSHDPFPLCDFLQKL
jgi:hypothetical protein